MSATSRVTKPTPVATRNSPVKEPEQPNSEVSSATPSAPQEIVFSGGYVLKNEGGYDVLVSRSGVERLVICPRKELEIPPSLEEVRDEDLAKACNRRGLADDWSLYGTGAPLPGAPGPPLFHSLLMTGLKIDGGYVIGKNMVYKYTNRDQIVNSKGIEALFGDERFLRQFEGG
jgi:hypothetical protein